MNSSATSGRCSSGRPDCSRWPGGGSCSRRSPWRVAGSFAFAWRDSHFHGRWLGDLLGSAWIWARLLPFYLAGTVGYLYRDRLRWDGRLAALAGVVLAAGSAARPALAAILPTAGAYALGWLAFTPRIRLAGAARYGDFSYGIYLFGYGLTQATVLLGGFRNPYALFVAVALPTIACGVLSWNLVERRFLGRRGATPVGVPAEVGAVPTGADSRLVPLGTAN